LLARAFADGPGEAPQRTRAVVIVHRDQVVAEQYAPGFGPETPLAGWSLAKSALNALIGVLVREGRLSFNERAPVPEWQGRDDDRGRITIEQLLRMSTGLRFSETYSGFLEDVMQMLFVEPDGAAFAASRPLDALPGTRWRYSSGTSNILARIIRVRVPSTDYAGFPRRALFEPLGMRGATLEADAAGNFLASSFMYARARDWARLGMLFLHDGVWRGRRLLPEGWVSFSRSATPGSPDGEFGAHLWLRVPVYYQAPGLPVVLPPDAFHAIGHEGQFISVIPSRDLVVVRLGLTRRASAWVHDRFLSEIISVVDRYP
jgi:CubicO group peptidase (beta-lactamase class C family)